MRYLPKDDRSPRELWDTSPWYEKLGMSLLIGIQVLPIFLGILQLVGIIR
jgi:hypothetical protein